MPVTPETKKGQRYSLSLFDEWPAVSKTVAAYYGNFEISDSEV
jgi:hypothetical protein